MRRLIISITCLAVCGTVVVASNRCYSEEDCWEGTCCATRSRDLSRCGRCRKMGGNRDRCNSPDAKLEYYGGKFASHCPCQDSFVCDTEGNERGLRRCTAIQDEEPEPEEQQEPPRDERCEFCDLGLC